LLVALLPCLALGACGGDDEPAADTTRTVPDLTVPRTEQEEPAPPETTETVAPPTTETVAPTEGNGGTPAPEPEPAPPSDTPTNDTPPPQDSPAERFEEFCNDNPGACG
jgi:hypothetical protein